MPIVSNYKLRSYECRMVITNQTDEPNSSILFLSSSIVRLESPLFDSIKLIHRAHPCPEFNSPTFVYGNMSTTVNPLSTRSSVTWLNKATWPAGVDLYKPVFRTIWILTKVKNKTMTEFYRNHKHSLGSLGEQNSITFYLLTKNDLTSWFRSFQVLKSSFCLTCLYCLFTFERWIKS